MTSANSTAAIAALQRLLVEPGAIDCSAQTFRNWRTGRERHQPPTRSTVINHRGTGLIALCCTTHDSLSRHRCTVVFRALIAHKPIGGVARHETCAQWPDEHSQLRLNRK